MFYHLIGMPTVDVVDNHPSWVVLEGCVSVDPEWTCGTCGYGWYSEYDDEESEEFFDALAGEDELR